MNLTAVCELLDLDDELGTLEILRSQINIDRQYLVDRRVQLIAAIEQMSDTDVEDDECLVPEESAD